MTAGKLFIRPYPPRLAFQTCVVEGCVGTLPAATDASTGVAVPARDVNGVYRSKADPAADGWAAEPDGARRQ